MVQGRVQTTLVIGERQGLRDVGRELVEGDGVYRAKYGVRKPAGRGNLQWEILAGAHAGVKGHRNRERQPGLALKNRELLFDAILKDAEVLLLQARIGGAVAIRD